MVRIAALVIGAVAIALAIPAQRLNIAFLVALAFAVAASANLPALLFNLFWRRFNTAGATASIYGGLIACGGPGDLLPGGLRDTPTSLIPNVDFAWFPLRNPGIDLHPDRLPLRHHRHPAQQGHQQPGPLRRAGGAVPHRRRGGEGDGALGLALAPRARRSTV